MTASGELGHFRSALDRLLPASRDVLLAASAYDPWCSRRLSLYLSLSQLDSRGSLRDQLLSRRPITLSQLLVRYLLDHPDGGSIAHLEETLQAWLARAPLTLFVADRRQSPARLRPALAHMTVRGIIRLRAEDYWVFGPTRIDTRFPHVPDIVQAQARQLSETLQAWERVTETHEAERSQDGGSAFVGRGMGSKSSV